MGSPSGVPGQRDAHRGLAGDVHRRRKRNEENTRRTDAWMPAGTAAKRQGVAHAHHQRLGAARLDGARHRRRRQRRRHQHVVAREVLGHPPAHCLRRRPPARTPRRSPRARAAPSAPSPARDRRAGPCDRGAPSRATSAATSPTSVHEVDRERAVEAGGLLARRGPARPAIWPSVDRGRSRGAPARPSSGRGEADAQPAGRSAHLGRRAAAAGPSRAPPARGRRWRRAGPRCPARSGSSRSMARACQASPRSGPTGVRARVGFRPKRPQHEAGIRIEPPPSPRPPARARGDGGPRPAAGAAGRALGSQGLRVGPSASGSVTGRMPNSGVLVLPIRISPAARNRATIVAS